MLRHVCCAVSTVALAFAAACSKKDDGAALAPAASALTASTVD